MLCFVGCWLHVVGCSYTQTCVDAAVLCCGLQAPIAGVEAEMVRDKYRSPVFKVDEAEHRWAVAWLSVHLSVSRCARTLLHRSLPQQTLP